MTTRSLLALVGASALLALTGCAAHHDDVAAETTGTTQDASTASSSTYYRVSRVDYRKCAWPLCGGVFVARVNSDQTKCVDGTWNTECHAVEVDFSKLALPPAQAEKLLGEAEAGHVVLRGTPVNHTLAGHVVPAFSVTEAWQAANPGQSPEGTFYRVKNNGIECVKAPCPSIGQDKLNSSVSKPITGLDLTGAGLNSKQTAGVFAELGGSGVIAVGHDAPAAQQGLSLVASAVYERVVPQIGYCQVDEECAMTAHAKPVSTKSDCYCTMCGDATDTTTATVSEAQFAKVCSSVHLICPAIKCMAREAKCIENKCTAVASGGLFRLRKHGTGWYVVSRMRPVTLLVAVLALAGCGGYTPYPEAQTVSDLGDGRFWIAGSDGLAGVYDGQRIVRRDYPMVKSDDDWAYAASSDVPAARVVMLAGNAYLFTRHADVLVWRETRGWQSVDVRFPADSGDRPQVNAVIVAPDGGVVVQLHSKTFAFAASPADLLASRFRAEAAPTYFTWVGFVEGTLYGVGWDASGYVRALWRHDASGWHQRSSLGKFTESTGFALRLPEGPVAVGRTDGLLVPSGAAEPERITLQHLGLGPESYAVGTATLAGHGPVLLISGNAPGVFELGVGVHRLWTVAPSVLEGRVIGAVPLGSGLRVVTSTPLVYDVHESRSVAEAPILVRLSQRRASGRLVSCDRQSACGSG